MKNQTQPKTACSCQPNACDCNTAARRAPHCGCQAARSAGCGCGPECACGPSCACSAA